MHEWIDGVGRANERGEQRAVLHPQRIDRKIEVPARRLGDAADPGVLRLTPVDRVEVHLQDLPLGQQQLEPDRQGGFA